jgi:hypothetical protein
MRAQQSGHKVESPPHSVQVIHQVIMNATLWWPGLVYVIFLP